MVVSNIIIRIHSVTAEKETGLYFHNKSRESSMSGGESVMQRQGREPSKLLNVQRGTVPHYVGVD
jgi:hypothetical protein